jgi:uncharacterized protein
MVLIYIIGIGGLIFLAFLIPGIFLFDPDATLMNPGYHAERKDILFILYLIISQHVSLFIIPGILLMIRLKNPLKIGYDELGKPAVSDILLVILLTICLFPVTGITGEFNSGLKLPEWFSGVENWIKERENMTERVFDITLADHSAGIVILNLIMLAVLPAIGEELIFRGILQKIFERMFKSGHIGVWVTAFIFSFAHFQFFGFLPRLILGLSFGYLFLWSGRLFLPVIAHFINNFAATLIGLSTDNDHLSVQNDYNIWAQLAIFILALIPVLIIMNRFRENARTQKLQEHSSLNQEPADH